MPAPCIGKPTTVTISYVMPFTGLSEADSVAVMSSIPTFLVENGGKHYLEACLAQVLGLDETKEVFSTTFPSNNPMYAVGYVRSLTFSLLSTSSSTHSSFFDLYGAWPDAPAPGAACDCTCLKDAWYANAQQVVSGLFSMAFNLYTNSAAEVLTPVFGT